MNLITEHKKCRACKNHLLTVLDLGKLHPSNFIDQDKLLEEDNKVPMVLGQCQSCGLVQLKHTLDLDLMYRQYWYKSSLNPSMIEALSNVVNSLHKNISLNSGDIVVDIGCNDGTMLSFFPPHVTKVGFDPAFNLKETAEKHTDYFINDYFTAQSYPLEQKASIVTSIAMFYDLEEIHEFIKDVKEILADDGVWVIQFTDLLSMLKINAVDNLCAEHLEYYSLHNIKQLMQAHSLQIFDVEYNQVNGGSLRAYIGHLRKHKVTDNVDFFLEEEMKYFNTFWNPMMAFSHRVNNIKNIVTSTIKELSNYSTIAAFGASTKGNTLLQVFGLDHTIIDHAAEVNEDKFGLKTAGTDIPIISQEESLSNPPDYYLVLPWHFIDDFIKRHQKYLNAGGRFIVPMPEPRIINSKGELLL